MQISISIVYILFGVLAAAVGEVLLKHGMNQIGPVTLNLNDIFSILWGIGTNPFVFGGLVLYLGGLVFWLAALSRVDLSYAYPFASLSYIIMLIASGLFLGEQISPTRLIGTLIIAIGVLVVARGG